MATRNGDDFGPASAPINLLDRRRAISVPTFPERITMQVEINDKMVLVDATLLGELLDVLPSDMPALMREHAITSVCERGIDTHEGEFRLSFFYQNRRAQLSVDASGQVLRRSIINFGDRPLPKALHRPETNRARRVPAEHP
jgi:hypothetical protein